MKTTVYELWHLSSFFGDTQVGQREYSSIENAYCDKSHFEDRFGLDDLTIVGVTREPLCG